MREIKFRAFDTTSKKMYSHKKIQEYALEQLCRIGLGDDYTKFMQYTGLKDKNGVEIYEGDIVKSLGASDYCFGVRPVEYIGSSFTIKGYGLCERLVEVIGNIYENPELLKVIYD